jgi:hypothetical protein
MIWGMRGKAWAVLAAVIIGAVFLAGCNRTKENRKLTVSSIPVFSPTFPQPSETVSIPISSLPAEASASASPSVTIHAAPAEPVRTARVDANGRHYDIKIWFETRTIECADHAYGQVADFLTAHPCRGLTRQLATTTVKGKEVGFNLSVVNIPGSDSTHLYDNASAFRTLVDKDGTGSVADLLREGYRLPSGPTAVPSPDAFRSMVQDAGISIYDMWYLDGPTPNNDPALEQMAQDIYLAY